MLLPSSCPVCRKPGDAPCARCRREIGPPRSAQPPSGVDGLVVVSTYSGAARSVLLALKHGAGRMAVPWLGEVLGGAIRSQEWTVDACAWVPTTAARRWRRGYDQAELLARATARRLGVPARSLFARRRGAAQEGRSATERRAGPPLRARGTAPAVVLVIDDVITTGGSLTSAAAALRAAGATTVYAAVVAAVPPPGAARQL